MTKLWPLASLAVLLSAQAVHGQTLTVDQQSLTFTAAVAGPPTSLPLNVTSTPSGVVVLTTVVEQTTSVIPWLSVSLPGGATPLALAVTVNPANLTAGNYIGSIVISVFGSGGSSVTVPVSLTVSTINVTPTLLNFQTSVGLTPAANSLTLSSGQMVSYTAAAATTTGGNWLAVSPPFGIVAGISAVSAIPNSAVVTLLSAGTYNGTITITPTSGNSATPIVIPVTLTVAPAPQVSVNPGTVNLEYQLGGAIATAQQTVTLTTTSPQGVAYTITATSQPNPSGGVWVVPNPLFGTITPSGTQITIGYNTAAGLLAGNYLSTVTVNTPNGSPTSTDIPVKLLISNQPLLIVPGNTLSFTYELGSASPASQSVNITSTAAATQNFTVAVSTKDGAAWLVAPATGSTGAALSISINPSGLAPGNYTGTVTVTGIGTGNGAQTIPVTLKVANDPAIVSNAPSLALPYQLGQLVVSQAIALTSSNGQPLNYSATASALTCGNNWLALSGASGTTNGQITVSVNSAGLSLGTCTGSISVVATSPQTGAPAINSPLSIPVTLTVSSGALLVASPLTPAVFSAPAAGAAPASQIFTLTSTDNSLLNFAVTASTVSGGSNWLQLSQLTGSTAAGFNRLAISAQPGGLSAGTYTGKVTITATGPGGAAVLNSPLTIPVTLQVTAGALQLSSTALTFQQASGGPTPANQVVSITSSGQPLSFAATAFNTGTVNWLSVSPSGGTPGSISVSVDGSKLSLGTYTGTVSVVSTSPNAGNSPAIIPVTLNVNTGTLGASPSALTFTQVQGGLPPVAQTVNVTGTPVPIQFTATVAADKGGSWLGVAPGSGATPGFPQVYVAVNSLTAGSYTGTVTIASPGAGGSPISIPVTLTVLPPYALSVNPTTLTFSAATGSKTVQTSTLALSSSGGNTTYSLTTQGGSWLSATPASGNTPATITVNVNPTGLASGSYSGTVTVTSPNAISPVSATVNLVVGTVAAPVVNAVANAASYGTGSFAPGENVVIFGTGIGPPELTHGTVTNGVVDSTIAATRVLFDGIAAPIIYAASTQTSVMVPYELSGRSTASLVVEYQGVQSTPLAYTVALTEPGIYTQNSQGSGSGAILNEGYTINLPNAPAPKGTVVSVYMTGEGFTIGAFDGLIAVTTLSPVLQVTATVGSIPATVTYVGTSPGIVTGATQVNVRIPLNAPSGPAVPIVITVGTGSAALQTQAGVTVAVQ